MAFNPHAPSASRDIDSVFTQARIPLVNAAMQLPGVQDFKLILGARRDHYSDIGEVTKSQIGLTWRLSESLSAHASASESYRPPSLVELYMPRVMVPTLIFDPAVGQLISIDLITGGNRMLRPTSGHSESVGVAFRPSEQWRISADYWRVKAKGHVSLFAPMSLLAHEQMALPGRVLRDESTGRLLQLDISRANVGGATTEGVDLAMDGELDTPMGRLSAGLSMTYTEKFLYSELPITQARMEDRAGIASEFGSIPKLRSVVSLAYQRGGWQATLHGRIISAYRDRDPRTGAPMQRRISGGPLWDLNLSKEVGGNVRVMVGAFNVMNQEPPFARAGGSLGFDNSQADLEGRELYIRLTGGF
jgi:iron complex outermembrane receptor protein